jgi:quinoprotein glucose dehydrogenase
MRILFFVLLCPGSPLWAGDWLSVGGDRGCMRYSPLTQINRDTVKHLKLAWSWETGEPARRTIECTPLIISGVMYLSTANRCVVALDAATGSEHWRFDPLSLGPHAGRLASGGVNRGVAYWTDGIAERILHGTADGRLFSLDAKTGKPDPGFGKAGVLSLREGIEYDISTLPYGPTSAPAIYKNLVYVGFSNSEGPPPGAPGDLRAFDVRTGKEAWRFHTIPRKGEFGYETWPEGAGKARSGANAWGGFSVDVKRGMVFAGLGSAGSDFYGGDRHGENLFANCTIALDAHTGRRIWHFQTLHHDLWDHDIPVYPNLVTVSHDGRRIDAVAQVTKTAHVFLFDRETGKPLFDVVEKPAPPSSIASEQAWPTQPVPVKPPPISRLAFTAGDISNVSPEIYADVKRRFDAMDSGPTHNPPSEKGAIVIPGLHGGATWSGASVDPETGILYVNSNNEPWVATLKKVQRNGKPWYNVGVQRFLDQEGHPAIKPPWGMLNAIDLNTGEFAWRRVLGEYPDLKARGIAPTGTENFGGTIVTAGGLVFIGGTKDEMFHAFDKATGELLWEYQLPAGGYATPATYSVKGRQYVVIAAGGAGKQRTKPGNQFLAFGL